MIIRNEVGHVMVFLSQQTSLPFTAIEVEALTARLALEFAREIGVDWIILEGDSEILIPALKSAYDSLSHFGYIRMTFSILPLCFQIYVFFFYAHRHWNSVARSLVRKAILYFS